MDKKSILFIACVSVSFFLVNTLFDYYYPPQVRKEVVSAAPVMPVAPIMPLLERVQGKAKETFYVLENDYQQLVFSTKGGAIAEINLPLKNKNQKSYVKEIGFDRLLDEAFPARSSLSADGKERQPQKGGYYPLLRRGNVSEHYAMNCSDGGDYQMIRFEKDLIQFEGDGVLKTYRLGNAPYCFTLEIQSEKEGLWLSSGVPDAEIVSNSYSPVLRYQTIKNKIAEVDTLDLPKNEPVQSIHTVPSWISNCNGFLGVLMQPLQGTISGYKSTLVEGKALPTRLSQLGTFAPEQYPGYATYLPVQSGVSSFRIFAGPYDSALLSDVGKEADYESAVEIQGWFSFISQPFAQFLSWLMKIFYMMTHSWALSIILLTVALKVMMFPLNTWSIKSSARMQEIGPRVKAIQERYKSDPKKAQVEVMNLYRSSGVNPLTGCLPVLLQMPFLVGMFYLLKSSVPLRGAVFIPGWINDLSSPDVLFSWKTSFWIIGNEFHLLPILMGVTMYLQQKLTSKLPKDGSQLTDQQKQQKMMGTMMAVLFTVMFYNFPSGLNIYFMLSTLLGLAQQFWVVKRMETVKV